MRACTVSLPSSPCDVFLDRESLVGRQSVKDQMQRFATSAHHPAQQLHEQRAGQGAGIGAEADGAFGDRYQPDPLIEIIKRGVTASSMASSKSSRHFWSVVHGQGAGQMTLTCKVQQETH